MSSLFLIHMGVCEVPQRVITDVFENMTKGTAHLLRKMHMHTKISCNSKWLFSNPRLLTLVLGTKGCRDRSSKMLYEGAPGHDYPTS